VKWLQRHQRWKSEKQLVWMSAACARHYQTALSVRRRRQRKEAIKLTVTASAVMRLGSLSLNDISNHVGSSLGSGGSQLALALVTLSGQTTAVATAAAVYQ